ncbi:acyl-CoA-binding protein [uncultured Streptomyces sp.]|uniref:acyl-CoA-binding protein n=1 Tax=uncultured Streptomyces sp. TaxID=174707 RepID=UPI002639483D|nr:acyl-CoA-binding protein [uncultured Streptomyces sp.]
MGSEAQFQKSADTVANLDKDGPIRPTSDDQLYLYKYFKQAKVGNNDTPKPGMMNFTAKYKWEAWTSVKDVSREESHEKYVSKLVEILEKVGDEKARGYIQEISALA